MDRRALASGWKRGPVSSIGSDARNIVGVGLLVFVLVSVFLRSATRTTLCARTRVMSMLTWTSWAWAWLTVCVTGTMRRRLLRQTLMDCRLPGLGVSCTDR